MRPVYRWGVSLAAAALLSLMGSALPGDDRYAGAEACADCHEEIVEAFRMTPHATGPGWETGKGCEGCHGPLADHAAGDPEAVVPFRDLAPRESSERCLSCHERQKRQFHSRRSVHGLNDVACTDCHQAHSTATNLLVGTSIERCGSCHQGIVAQASLPRSHPPVAGGKFGWNEDLPKAMSCEACHLPHTQNPLRANRGFGKATCGDCHVEKYGPFLYAHDTSMVDGCASCHTAHGSTNRHMLKHERTINLCYQCHPGTSTPSFHSAQNFLGEKCTVCHTAIHGSNTNPFFLEE